MAGTPANAQDPATIAWADAVAAAIDAGVLGVLEVDSIAPTDPGYPEILAAAQLGALELYQRRAAPFGVVGFADPMGNAIRLARDWLDAIRPQLRRWHRTGGVTVA
jgi:hypothetical protein